MSTAHLSAIELLELGDEGRNKSFLGSIWPNLLGVAFGVGTGAVLNLAFRRPLSSGVQKYVFGVVGWVAVLNYVQQKRNDYLAEKDAVLRHYVQLHPEDFVVPERKKIGDIFEPWIPIR